MKRGGPDHPKTFALAEALGIRRRDAVGLLEMLFHFTSQYAPRGDIGRYSDKRIAAAVDWNGKPSKLIEGLLATGWIEHHSEVKLVVHDWWDHADRSTLQRLARAGKSTVLQNVGVTGKVCTTDDGVTRTPPEPVPPPNPNPVPMPTETAGNGHAPMQENLGVQLVPATVLDFRDWIRPWQRCSDPGEVADLWKSTVITQDDVRGAFAARDRYLASDEVRRNFIMSPQRFLVEQKKAEWAGIWPAATTDKISASRATTLAVMRSTQPKAR